MRKENNQILYEMEQNIIITKINTTTTTFVIAKTTKIIIIT